MPERWYTLCPCGHNAPGQLGACPRCGSYYVRYQDIGWLFVDVYAEKSPEMMREGAA